MTLPDLAKKLIDSHVFATLCTTNPDGAPQSSVIWLKREGDEVVFSTIQGRRKTKNIQRDSRVSVSFFDPANPYSYVEVRGTVSLDEAGGPELIQELSQLYTGHPYSEQDPSSVRLVCRITPTKVIAR
jgi:PPOX class probable F420-dependent enzyme